MKFDFSKILFMDKARDTLAGHEKSEQKKGCNWT